MQNTQRLTENLSRLTESYKDAWGLRRKQIITEEKYAELVANKAEMLAYLIIVTSGNIDGEQ